MPPDAAQRALLALIVSIGLGLHIYMIWLGGGWRIFAIVEACLGVFLARASRDLKTP